MPPISHEDTSAAGSLTGDPDPVRPLTRDQMQQAQKAQVRQKQRGPQVPEGIQQAEKKVSQDQPTEGDASPPEEKKPEQNPLAALGQGLQKGQAAVEKQRPFSNLNPFSPLDWAKMQANNASDVYYWGRGAYGAFSAFLDPNAVHQSVSNIWNENSAQSAVMRQVLTATAAQSAAGLVEQHAFGMSPEQAAGTNAGITATSLANPSSYVMPGSATGMLAGVVGPSVMQAILSTNPDEQVQGATWAALTAGLLSAGHIPGPIRDQLMRIMGKWPDTEQFMKQVLSSRAAKAADAQDPLKSPVKDWLDEQLARGGFKGSEVTLAKGLKAGEQQLGVAKQTATGAIVVSGRELERQKQAVLKKLGVGSVDELVERAREQPLTGRAAKAIMEHWQTLGLPYDLKGIYAADSPLRDPRRALLEIHNAGDEAAKSKATTALSLTHHLLDQIHRGPFANEERPLQSLWRSLIGSHRATNLVEEDWRTALGDLGAHAKLDGTQISRAIEGDAEVYASLPPEGRLIVDTTRLVTNGLRDASKDTAYAENFVGNWLPRLDRISEAERKAKGAAQRSGVGALVGEARKHRTTAITTDEAGRLVGGQAYETIQAANRAIKAEKDGFVGHVLNPLEALPKTLQNDPQVVAIREMVASDPVAARQMALEEAARRFKPKEEDFFKIVGRGAFGRQANAVHSHMAVQHLLEQQIKVTDPATGKQVLKKAAVYLAQNPRENQAYRELGYRPVNLPHFSNVLVHPDFAALLERAITHQYAGAKGLMKGALDLEGAAIAKIMYSPAIHGMNVAGRLGTFAMQYPLRTLSYMLGKGTDYEKNASDFGYSLRREAYNAGVLPRSHNKSGLIDLGRATADIFGDPSLADAPELVDKGEGPANGVLGELANVGKAAPSALTHLQNAFWGKVNDFGVMAYHVEKQAALARGVDPITASLHAANRANTWMGFVRPEDTNPLTHSIARSLFFAPSWWRTWAELFVPYYGRAGYDVTPALARHMAISEAKVVYAAFAMQKLSGNAFNYMTSGHLQNENLPGNQDRIEITNPDVIRALQAVGYPGAAKIDPATGVDSATGGRLTLENPLARQQLATEGAAGLESGQPGPPTLEDVESGGADVLVNRLSPLLEALGTAANLDIYRSVHDHQLRATNPDRPAFEPDAMNALYAILYMSPFGTRLTSQIANDLSAGKEPGKPVDTGIPGIKVPQGVREIAGSAKQALAQLLFTGLTGINPPYEYSARTRGVPPSDQDYRNLQQVQQQYQTDMSTLSAQALGGQVTPNQWLSSYRDQSTRHSAAVQAIFKNAPQYAQGTDALVSQYESLYDRANVNGVLDPSTLDQLQGQFRASHSQAAMNAMDAELAKNDQKYPMLALYHKTTHAYLSWQEQWAASKGYDVGTIRAEARQYGALYTDKAAAGKFYAQHPELRAYEVAKRTQFEESPAGLMYGLFYDSSVVARYMRAHHLNEQQVEQEVMAS